MSNQPEYEYDMESDDHKEFVKNVDHSKLAANQKMIAEHDSGNPRLPRLSLLIRYFIFLVI